jgi:hypothetical protein
MTRLAVESGGYHKHMWDPRIVLGLVHRYGEACRREEHADAGSLYSQIVRALDTAPVESEDRVEVEGLEEMTSYG